MCLLSLSSRLYATWLVNRIKTATLTSQDYKWNISSSNEQHLPWAKWDVKQPTCRHSGSTLTCACISWCIPPSTHMSHINISESKTWGLTIKTMHNTWQIWLNLVMVGSHNMGKKVLINTIRKCDSLETGTSAWYNMKSVQWSCKYDGYSWRCRSCNNESRLFITCTWNMNNKCFHFLYFLTLSLGYAILF